MMYASLDLKFTENTEAIVTQFGFKDLRSFVKNQALLLLMARIEKYEAENKRFETRHNMPFAMFQEKLAALQNEEVFAQEDDYLDWRFAKEVMDRLKRQKQEMVQPFLLKNTFSKIKIESMPIIGKTCMAP